MSTSHQANTGGQADFRGSAARSATGTSPSASGLALFAGTLMIIAGIFQAVSGLVALFQNELHVVGINYVFSFDVTTWGWSHLLVGVLVAVAGAAVFIGQLWGRMVGIGLAILSMIANYSTVAPLTAECGPPSRQFAGDEERQNSNQTATCVPRIDPIQRTWVAFVLDDSSNRDTASRAGRTFSADERRRTALTGAAYDTVLRAS